MATVETLELRIVDNSVKAANGVNKLAATLQRLKGITSGNLGLVKVSNQMERFTKAISGLNEDYVRRLERTAKAIQKISAAGKLNLPTYNQIKRATEPSKKKVEEVIPETKQSGIAAFLNRITSSLGPTNALRLSLNRLGDAADKANKKVNAPGKRGYGFLDSAKFLLKYQLIFKLFSMVTNAVKEGISNLYEWSKATNGVFAKSLDSAKSKILLLKNSIATALAPAITALIPVFNAVANAVVFCLNAIAQLISAFRGLGTWTKATDAVGDYTAAVKGAGAAQKGLLASFDELNVISSKSGGGGGGMANAWGGAFEEKELSPFFKWISDHLLLVQTLVVGIGGAFLGWKLSESFTSIITSLATGNWKAAIIAGIGAAILWLITHWDEVKVAVSNAWDKVSVWLGKAGRWLKDAWKDGMNWFVTRWTGIGSSVSRAWQKVKEWLSDRKTDFTTAWTGSIEYLSGVWGSIKDSVSGAWDKVKDWFVDKKTNVETAWSGTKDYLVGLWDSVKSSISGAWDSLKTWMDEKVLEPIKVALNAVLTWIDTYIISPLNSVLTPIINLINTIISWVSKKDTKVIEIKTTKSLPPVSGTTPSGHSYTATYTPPVSHGAGMAGMEMVDFQAKADGGFVNSGQLFVAREAGPELVGTIGGRTAVANNDQIIAGVASGVAAGQEEQNALLRKQNEILTRLLAKEFSAKVVPSAALGRVASQSEAMYRQMAGVNV